jgi:hypothetical protein
MSRDKSVRRSAQDDDFVASWRRQKTSVKLALMGSCPGILSAVPFDKLRASSSALISGSSGSYSAF